MNLYLSHGNHVADTAYTTVDKRTIFRAKTPWSIFGKKTVITGSASDTLARIRWKKAGSTVLEMGGYEVKAKKYIKHGKRFTAPDGKQYKWTTKHNKPMLLHCGIFSNAPVAKFHTKHSGLFTRNRKAYLEVLPDGEHILEAILVTFIYYETVRQSSKKDRNYDGIDLASGTDSGGGSSDSGGGGGDGGGVSF